MGTLVLIVIYQDFLCYMVYGPQGCNKLEFNYNALIENLASFKHSRQQNTPSFENFHFHTGLQKNCASGIL